MHETPPRPCSRGERFLLIVAACAGSWLWMMAIHEAGHVIAALLTGGTVQQVVLHPLAISRTDVDPNPRPLLVCWSGPIFGVLAPLTVWGFARRQRLHGEFILRFLAGFCLIANGAYLGAGVWAPVGDAADLLRMGTPRWMLGAFGLPCIIAGLVLWNGLGKRFGLGNETHVDRRTTHVVTALVALTIVVEWILSPTD